MISFPKLLLAIILWGTTNAAIAQRKTIDQRVDSVLRLMTLQEKIGQLNQYTGEWDATGPITKDGDKQNQIRQGLVGSMLNVTGVEHTRALQEIAMQSRMKIPLLFGQDVIHGYRTIFPIPLAEACSWDLDAMERSARIAAIEASAVGVHWTFAPMVDIARDPRWGRVMEGAGEDTYLGSLIATARVKGFQGKGLGNNDALMACAKHFAAYGAAVGGRDYNSVDMSLRQLSEVYLPPFKAASDAGVATFMNSFNDINGIPATGNKYIQRTLLKGQWGFKGFVVSDWGSIGEMKNHGNVKDDAEAALSAITAGSDMDMESRCYKNQLAQLVKENKVNINLVDDAVKRILKKKMELGLFDNPYKFCDAQKEKDQWNNVAHLQEARQSAQKSIVLLKNEKQLLPLSKQTSKIVLIGPLAKAVREHLGFWSYSWPDDTTRITTIYDAVKNKLGNAAQLFYAQGCGIKDSSRAGFNEAVAAAQEADIVVLTVGEAGNMSGEAKSRSSISLPGVQEELARAIIATGKPVVVLISAGRPLVFNWIADSAPAIVYSWWLGTEGGNAIADVLFGDYNPSGKLVMSFPRTEGQIPIYYNHFNTGRPASNDKDVNYVSAYTDLPNSPKYPFGYGLSYTKFNYSDIQLNKNTITAKEKLQASITIKNTGAYTGTETVQLYIRDMVGSVVRPVKELKGFQQITLKPGESKEVKFTVGVNDLKFFNDNLQYNYEPGSFQLMIGTNAQEVKTVGFEVK